LINRAIDRCLHSCKLAHWFIAFIFCWWHWRRLNVMSGGRQEHDRWRVVDISASTISLLTGLE